MTPEGKVKAKVKALLNSYGERLYHHWPVPNGMGEPTLDCVGAINGRSFAIETKKPGAEPTPRQWQTIRAMEAANIEVWVIDGTNIDLLKEWLDTWVIRGIVEDGI